MKAYLQGIKMARENKREKRHDRLIKAVTTTRQTKDTATSWRYRLRIKGC